MDEFSRLRQDLLLCPRLLYLNTGGQGPIPAPARDAMLRELCLSAELGPGSADGYRRADEVVAALRKTLASFIGAEPDDLLLTTSTGEGIALFAASLSLWSGDEVIASDEEHPAGLFPWWRLAERGIVLRTIPVMPIDTFADRLISSLTPAARVISLSHVSYLTGTILPIQEICAAARDRNILTVVDGAQSVGAIPVDLEHIGCDAYAFPGQKWLLGPAGTGGLFVSPRIRNQLSPSVVTTAALAERISDGTIRYRDDCGRLQLSRPGPWLAVALGTAVKGLEELGIGAISDRLAGLTAAASRLLDNEPHIRVITPDVHPRSGLLTFVVADRMAQEVQETLLASDIVVRTVTLPDGSSAVRASLHCFCDEADVRRLAEACAGLA